MYDRVSDGLPVTPGGAQSSSQERYATAVKVPAIRMHKVRRDGCVSMQQVQKSPFGVEGAGQGGVSCASMEAAQKAGKTQETALDGNLQAIGQANGKRAGQSFLHAVTIRGLTESSKRVSVLALTRDTPLLGSTAALHAGGPTQASLPEPHPRPTPKSMAVKGAPLLQQDAGVSKANVMQQKDQTPLVERQPSDGMQRQSSRQLGVADWLSGIAAQNGEPPAQGATQAEPTQPPAATNLENEQQEASDATTVSDTGRDATVATTPAQPQTKGKTRDTSQSRPRRSNCKERKPSS